MAESNASKFSSKITSDGTIGQGGLAAGVGGTDWQAVITAAGGSNTASAGEGYFIDTTSDVHTINLPSSPSQGDEVTIVDYAGTFGTNNVTVGRNGSNIDNTANDATLATNRLNVRFVYVDATQGWRAIFDDASENYGATYISATGGTITTSGNYKIHTFTGDGCFVVSQTATGIAPNVVDYLVVAGGGSGPTTNGGDGISGGGGAGGFRFYASPTCNPQSGPGAPLNAPAGITVSTTTYPVTVGGGGTISSLGSPGSNSVFSTITSTGGGRGGRGDPNANGQPGGSGGGGDNGCDPGGTGNTPPVSPPQGNNGGNASTPNAATADGGGGGPVRTPQRVLVDRIIASIKSQVAGIDSGFGSEEKLEALDIPDEEDILDLMQSVWENGGITESGMITLIAPASPSCVRTSSVNAAFRYSSKLRS